MHQLKKKYFRANEAPFMARERHKVIMKKSRLRNKFLKGKNETYKKDFKL